MAYHQNGGNRGNSGNGFGVILEAAPPTPGGNSGNSGNGGNRLCVIRVEILEIGEMDLGKSSSRFFCQHFALLICFFAIFTHSFLF